MGRIRTAALDKRRHFWIGFLIFLATALITAGYGVGAGGQILLAALFGNINGAIATVFAAWAKEQYDLHHIDTHTPDQEDVIATMGGGLGGVLVFNLIILCLVLWQQT